MNVTLWDTSSDVRKELSIQDDRTESDNRIEVMLLIGIAENNLPHIARWESTKPPYAEPHVRWCGRSVNVKIGGKCLLWLAFTSYPIMTSLALYYLCTRYTLPLHILYITLEFSVPSLWTYIPWHWTYIPWHWTHIPWHWTVLYIVIKALVFLYWLYI